MEEFKGDKRTKEYKEWKEKYESKPKGLGDTVSNILEASGVSKIAKSILGDDCGCDERKDALNKIMKYKVYNCLEEDEFNYLTDFLEKKEEVGQIRISPQVQREILDIYNRVFNKKQQPTSCNSCVYTIVNHLEKLLKNS